MEVSYGKSNRMFCSDQFPHLLYWGMGSLYPKRAWIPLNPSPLHHFFSQFLYILITNKTMFDGIEEGKYYEK